MFNEGNFKQKRQKSNLIKIGDVIPKVKETFDIKKSLNLMAIKEIWPLITSFEIAKRSQPAYFDKENNLVISIRSSVLATELSMQKNYILEKLKKATENTDIKFKDVRFTTRF